MKQWRSNQEWEGNFFVFLHELMLLTLQDKIIYLQTWRSTKVKREVFVVMLWTAEPTEPATEAPDDKCSSDEFTCGDGTCIPLSQRCDWTEYHCPDGTDEFDCRTSALIFPSTAVFVNSTWSFLAHNSIICRTHYSYRPSVCPSVTRINQSKTV